MTDWLDTMVRELGEKWIGGPWDPREDIPRHTMGDLDALQNDYCLRLVSKLRAWADPLEPEEQIRMLLHLWWECFGLWDRSLAYRTIEAVADAVAKVVAVAVAVAEVEVEDEDGVVTEVDVMAEVDVVSARADWPPWQRDTWLAVGAALKLMQLDGRVFKETNLSCAEKLRSVTREAIPQMEEIQDRLKCAWHQLMEQPGGAGKKIRPCVSYIWEYTRQISAYYHVIEKTAGTMMEFECWLASARPASGPQHPGAASPALWRLSWDDERRAEVVQALEFLEKKRAESRFSSYILSEIQPWEQMLIVLRDLMTRDPERDIAPSVLIPRQVWVRYCFPFAVQDDDGKRAKRLLHGLPKVDPDDPSPDSGPEQSPDQDQSETSQIPLNIRLKEQLGEVGLDLKIGEPTKLAQTEFFQVGTGTDEHFGGIRIDLPDLTFVRDFLDDVGRRPYQAWLDLNRMGNFCLCVEATEPLKDIPPQRLYRALRAGTPFVFGEPVTLAPQYADERPGGEVGQPPQWDNLHTFARGMIRAVADAYYFPDCKQAREAPTDLDHYVRTNPHVVVVVQTDAPIAVQAEEIAGQLDSAVGGRILLRSLQRAAGTLEEWTRFPPLQSARASAVVAVPEIGYAGDWFVHTGETTVFGIVAVPAWLRAVYPEVAQFASSWSPVLQLWNRRLQKVIRKGRGKGDAATGADSDELRNVEQEVRRHLAEINAEDLCATLAYRRFLDGLLAAVGIGRLEKELEAQLQAAEQLTDYFYQHEEKLHQQEENKAAKRRDILLTLITLLGVFSLADFLALLDTTDYHGHIGFIRLSYEGRWQDVLVLVIFGLAVIGGIFAFFQDWLRNWWVRSARPGKSRASRSGQRHDDPGHDREARLFGRPDRRGFLPDRSAAELQCRRTRDPGQRRRGHAGGPHLRAAGPDGGGRDRRRGGRRLVRGQPGCVVFLHRRAG